MTNKFIFKRLMMVTTFILFCSVPLALAQTQHADQITLTVNKKPLEKILEELSKQYEYQFFYNSSLLKGANISVSFQKTSIDNVMKTVLAGKGLQYSIKGKTIVITAILSKAQPKVLLKGHVSDSDGNEIPGVTILTQDMEQGVVTDIDGNFSFAKPLEYGAVLNFSSVGMKPTNVVYSGEALLQVVMVEDIKQLDAVIVTGFQTISRERSTGAATIVNQNHLQKIQSLDLGSKLEGLAPGLTTYNGNMSIRGISSFAINSTPLLVLDGQPVAGVSINELNPEDIETITILKDAAAASLYGVRASNGVIVVTTKQGITKKPNINISAGFYLNPLPSLQYQHYASTSDIIDYERSFLINNPAYAESPLGYFTNINNIENPQYISQVGRLYYEMALGNITEDQLNKSLDALRKNDYRKEYRKALQQMSFTQDYQLSVSKGGDNSSLFFSAHYENYGSYNKNDQQDKFSFYLKNELNLTNWFKLSVGANASIGNSQYGQADIGLQGATKAMPYDTIHDPDGSLSYLYPTNYYLAQKLGETEGLNQMGYNAIEEDKNNIEKTKDMYWKLFTHADFKLLKGLSLGLKFQYENRIQNSERYDEAESYFMRVRINEYATTNPNGGYIYNVPTGGHLEESHSQWSFMNFRTQFDYKTTIADKHDITALVGGEIREDKYRRTQSERYGYDEDKLTFQYVDWATLNRQGVIGQLNGSRRTLAELLKVSDSHHRYVSAYFNAAYSYDSRYAINGSVRIEQADLFGTDPKYRYQPLWSVGVSWNASNETFISSITWIDMAKLRITYGTTGNVDQNSSPYLLGAYVTSPYSGANLTSILSPPNSMLRWEKTSTFNIGLDFMLLKKLTGSFDFYSRQSSDLLANKSMDPSIGFETVRMNNGSMRNTGIEFSITYDWIKHNDWSLNTTLTTTYNKNKITKVGYQPTDAINMLTEPGNYYLEGDTYNSLYAYHYAGLTEDGHPSVYDAEGNIISLQPVRDIAALVCSGQLDPKWSGAFDLFLRWKSLSLYTKIVYYAGHNLRVDATKLYSGVFNGEVHEDIVNRWRPNHTDTDIPSMNLYGLQSERNYHWKYADYNTANASFIKIRNIGINYALPQQWIAKSGFKNISVRAQINNPCYWAANNHDIDPEAFQANDGIRTIEKSPSYILGIHINF